ncbi:hypothetical protein [Methylobacillus sp.]|uniref:hypothetical protein n=1 Tax=Methylobacillus sp. TaxID=56818 RepID=UPI0012C0AB96|nr:hypothetical protein [Methylobacillus sp.]MPS47815.1 hypothetical protein [Methylobacillus sp.]
MAAIEVNIDDLILDLNNPRFEQLENQKDALEKIIVQQGKKIVNLAEDILNQGLSPAHRILVISSDSHKGKFTVLDGNRRTTALKLLTNPALLDGMKDVGDITKKQLRGFADLFDRNSIEPLSVYECENEEEARHWIEAIHTGENEGRGVVDWDGIATARYRGKSSSLKIIDFVKSHGSLTDDELKSLERISITNLDRLIGTEEVRNRLGLELEGGELYSDLDVNELIRPLKKIVLDIASKKIKVGNIHTRTNRINYLDELGDSLPDLSKRTGVAKPIGDLKSTADNNGSKDKKQKPRTKANRKSLIPADCKLNIDNAKIEEIYYELRKLPLESYPNGIAALARIFIELSADHYGKKNINNWSIDDSLKRKIDIVANDLQVNKSMHKRDLEPFRRIASSRDAGLSIDRLHGAIHSKNTLPTSVELRKGWDELEEVFKVIWK